MRRLGHLRKVLQALLLLMMAMTGLYARNAYDLISNKQVYTNVDTAQINRQIRHAYDICGYEYDSSIYLNNEALIESIKIGYKGGIVKALINIGGAYNDKGNFEKGLQYLGKALIYSQQEGMDQHYLAMIYLNMANIYVRLGKFDTAAANYYKALGETEHYESINYNSAISVYTRVASFWDIQGDHAKALYYIGKAIDLAVKTNNLSDLATAILIKSNIYVNVASDSAIYYCKEAIVLSRKTNNIRTLHTAIMDIGATHINKPHPEPAQAIPWLQIAIKQNEEVNDPMLLARSYNYLGHAYYMLHDYKNAEKNLQKAVLTQSKVIELKDHDLFEAHNDLANVYIKLKDYKRAFAELKIYKRIEDSLQTKEKAIAVSQVYTKYQVAEKNKALAEKQVLLLQQQNNIKKKDFWIAGISSVAFLVVVLFLSLFRNNQHKAKIGKLNAIMQGEENERARIARELHDGIGGMLSSIQLNLSSVKEEYAAFGIKRLDDILYMLQDTSTEVRKTSHNLMPDALTRHSFVEAMVLYCENVTAGSELDIDLQINGDLQEMNKGTELVLYRILQELIQNIIKHAKASYAVIQIMRVQEKLSITIEDNGIGFDTHKNSNGYGLQNLQFRIQALHGKIFIVSAEGKGTTTRIEFGLQKLKNNITA